MTNEIMLPEEYTSLTINEFMKKSAELSKQALAIDPSHLTVENIQPEELKIISDFLATKSFLDKANTAQAFLTASTVELSDGKNIKMYSLMPSSQYSKALGIVTNNLDNNFLSLCALNDAQESDYSLVPNKVSTRINHLQASSRDEYAITISKGITVAQIMKIIEELRIEMEKILEENKEAEQAAEEQRRQEEENSLEEKPLEDKVLESMVKLAAAGALYEIAQISVKELQKQTVITRDEKLIEAREKASKGTAEKPSIVTIGGGYAVIPYVEQGKENTVAIENLLEADVNAKGEYMPAVKNPEKTTNDAAKAGGNVQLVEKSDFGSIEAADESAKPAKKAKSMSVDIDR